MTDFVHQVLLVLFGLEYCVLDSSDAVGGFFLYFFYSFLQGELAPPHARTLHALVHYSLHDFLLPLFAEKQALIDVVVDFVAEYFEFFVVQFIVSRGESEGGLGDGRRLGVLDLVGGDLLFGEELLLSIAGVGEWTVFGIVDVRSDVVGGVLGLELVYFESDALQLIPSLGDGTIHYIIIHLTESLPIIITFTF